MLIQGAGLLRRDENPVCVWKGDLRKSSQKECWSIGLELIFADFQVSVQMAFPEVTVLSDAL